MKPGRARSLRRTIQTASLILFLYLLWNTLQPRPQTFLPADAFLRLDPLAAVLLPVAAREWLLRLWPGLVVAASALLVGRLFCGWLCPLGATLDLARGLQNLAAGNRKAPAGSPPLSRRSKFLVLFAVVGASLLGVNLAFWGSPLALITRFYALCLHPLLLLTGQEALSAGRPLLEALGPLGPLGSFDPAYLEIVPRRYAGLWFLLVFFGALFVLERFWPRFWCRFLCPAGALLGLIAFRPLWRRRVSACSECGRCAGACPSGAADGQGTDTTECLACQACIPVCPEGAGRFTFGPGARPSPAGLHARRAFLGAAELPSRRAFLGAAGCGALLAGVQYSGLNSLLRPGRDGLIRAEDLIRPPGALPEPAFLDRCLRCGECMKVCPTNALQPALGQTGVDGLFSPVLTPRRGPCEPECAACGRVCPTQALQSLPLEEKQWAKVGTAVVLPYRCLAWAEGRRCMVCQETCPYGAVKVVQREGAAVPVPVVDALRCFGCGSCEFHCPVRLSAIAVQPLNALRLTTADYKAAAQDMGLILTPGQKELQEELPPGGLPPGFSE